MNKHIKILGIFVLASGLIVGCSEQSATKNEPSHDVEGKTQEENPNKQVNEESEDESKEEPKEEPKDEPKKVLINEVNALQMGDTADIGGIKVTVTSIERYTGEMRQFRALKQDHAVKIGAIIKNTKDSEIHPTSYRFTLYDVEGNKLKYAWPAWPGGKTRLREDLPPGKKIQGDIFFDVPAQEGSWTLKYSSVVNYAEPAAFWEIPAK
ncbi:DUF4352 domain-containing protein [Virgibacillus salinus]|uniref:DUF4352 domain-containing protein n=1 Tax=Virgibacillus salinus TaxID=553311 RepID=A0A1H1FNQ7_9BACI|nr:DUF4352 domain-containing protein [Virgibacillus salinus]SDR02683.1 protein of unknown function [Virgibacillus salinus]